MYSTILIKSELTYLELTEVTEDLLLSLLLLPPYPPPPPPPPPPLRPPSPLAIMVSRRRRPLSRKKSTFSSSPAHSFPIKLERPKMKKSITRPRPPFFPRNRSRPPRLQKEMTCPIIFLGPRESRARDKDLFSRSSESNPRFIRALCIPGKRRL